MSRWRIKGTAGPQVNRAWPLDEQLCFVLSGNDTVGVSEEGEGEVLAILSLGTEDRPRLERRSQGVTLEVNGKTWDAGVLTLGDEVRIGTSRFLLQAPGLRPDRVLAPEARPTAGRHRALWVVITCLLAISAAVAWWLLRQGVSV